MRPSDFFTEADFPVLGGTRRVFDADRADKLRLTSEEGTSDLDAGYVLAKLAYDDLTSFGTGSGKQLSNENLSVVLRSLRAILGRVGVKFDPPPFRDFDGFKSYWISHGMSGSWAARREYVSELFDPVFSRLTQLEDEQTQGGIRGVDGELKNIIFASTGPKPRIVLRDAINNVIEVAENGQYCLFYDRPLSDAGLTWSDLVDWWKATNTQEDKSDVEVGRDLFRRLAASLASPPENTLFRTYCERYRGDDGGEQPALLPQVY